jgi:hypothetical protein
MLSLSRSLASLGLALVALAVPAAAHADTATPPHVPVPAGQLQHTVTEISFPRSTNTFHHDKLRNERWIGATAGREIVTDLSLNDVRSDCQYRLTVVRCWEAPISSHQPSAGTIYIYPGKPFLLQSWDDLGANVKSLFGVAGGYRAIGNTTFLGRPAVTLAQDPQRGPDGGIESASIVAEADNFYPLLRVDVDTDQPFHDPGGKKGLERVEEVTTTKTMEVVSPHGVKLTMDRHPKAKVVDERPAARAARKKAREKAAAAR